MDYLISRGYVNGTFDGDRFTHRFYAVIKLDPGDSIHNIYGAREVDVLRVLTSEGVTEVPISEIKLKSGIAAGQKVISQKPVIKCELVYQS
jgi:hypothetical protein